MANCVKRFYRTRSSKQFCKEKFACQGEKSEAEFQCDSCGTIQCVACEAKLHCLKKCVHHDRERLTPVSKELLCEYSCLDKNYADVICVNCNLRCCDPCFHRNHSESKRKLHQRTKFKPPIYTDNKLATSNISSEFVDAVSHFDGAIQPSSPIGLDIDANLTYFSMPQTQVNASNGNTFNMSKKTVSKKDTAGLQDQGRQGQVVRSGNIDLFAEDPTFQDADATDTMHFTDLSLNSQKHREFSSSPGLSGNEDSEPESSRHSSINADDVFQNCRSFPVADQSETIQVGSVEDFIEKLGCDEDNQVKVISIFGNTGDGKSYTLNHTFFGGREIFKTSSSPASCTSGVWAAFDPVHEAIIIDTEGLLGVSPNQNQRTRLLLKVLALSDIVIYRSRAERLHNDLFQFLADASKAYVKHFTPELKAASKRFGKNLPLSDLGPMVLIFHETLHTEVLGKNSSESPDELLRKRFLDMELSIEAFSSLHYIGTQTQQIPTDFNGLLLAVKNKLRDFSVRSPRKPLVIYNALQVLNDKFSGDIEKDLPDTFPDKYFTCRSQCLSCNMKCSNSMNHMQDKIPHSSTKRCSYRFEYENKIYLCKSCFTRGNEMIVVPKTSASSENSWFGLAKFAWSGYVLECPSCGVIYRSRQYWYGNEDPDKSDVQTEIRHVWPGNNPVLQGSHNAARRVLDGIHYVSNSIASVGYKPTKMVTNWVTDKIAPSYWVPNSQISHCYQCEKRFDEEPDIHHCRGCGKGFCDDCSSNRKRVPETGWGDMLVRVCDNCFAGTVMTDSSESTNDINPRRVGEAIGSTVGTVASFVNYPLDVLRESARPSYWVPDSAIEDCVMCHKPFGPKLRIHHCRGCGEGVCDECSGHRRKVASRGWDYPVRVCDACNINKKEL